MKNIVYHAANTLSRHFVLPFYASYKVIGRENVPHTGPLLVASNHLNDGDPGILAWGIPRKLVFMTKAELFKIPVLKQFLMAYGAFPVRRNEADRAALRTAREVLEQDLALVVYPEGTRSGEDARLMEAWPGVALIALRSDATILPCAITGSQHMSMPKMFFVPFRRWRITLTIGEPFHLPATDRLNAESARAGTRVIMEKIAALLPEEYRGYYGSTDSPDSLSGAPVGD